MNLPHNPTPFWNKAIFATLVFHAILVIYYAGRITERMDNVSVRLDRLECRIFDGCGGTNAPLSDPYPLP